MANQAHDERRTEEQVPKALFCQILRYLGTPKQTDSLPDVAVPWVVECPINNIMSS
jgi:hypothetical protein